MNRDVEGLKSDWSNATGSTAIMVVLFYSISILLSYQECERI